MKIKINKHELKNIIKESIMDVLKNISQNDSYFQTYNDFLKFFEESDGTMEYLYLSKKETGLSVDIYIDDCGSFKRYNHPLWLYFCDGHSHNDNLIPISVSNNPLILVANYNINLPSVEISSIKNFILENLQNLNNIANERIDSVDFVNNMNKNVYSFKVAESVCSINEMAKLESKYTNLGFDIFIDATPRVTGHNEYRLKYPINKKAEQGNNSHNYTPMSICENPEFLPPASVSAFNAIADMKRKKNNAKFYKKTLCRTSTSFRWNKKHKRI